MSNQEAAQMNPGSERTPIMVVTQAETGFRVYAANDPARVFDVTGGPEAPACNCPEWQWRRGRNGYRCAHIEAVFKETGVIELGRVNPVPEPMPVSGSATPANDGNGFETSNGPAVMVLKRSVSPDGRIDSLSVEFSQPIATISASEVLDQAINTLLAQSAIVYEFLHDGEVDTDNQPASNQPSADGGEPAQMLDIGGMQTRWGWRFFINVKVNGNTLRLFGNRKQLADQLAAAGYQDRASNINKGVALNLPCRVVTEPTPDGKYVNIVQVLPSHAANQSYVGRTR